MNYQVALSFEDGVTRFVTCAEDQTVADASYRARINIPLDCRDGACGTCKAFCESGAYDGGTYIDDALSADEAAAGYVLPCSMRPRSDLVLRIASTSAVAKTQASSYTGTLTALERLSPTTVAVTVETPDRGELAFLSGQYVNITVPGTDVTRSYSFSNAPDDKELTFLVKLSPGGVMSDYLTERAAVGDELTFAGPNGSFFLRDTDRPVLLLAGGTGLAPILSILRTMRSRRSTCPVHLVYGASTDDDVVELDTLADLASQVEGLTWEYCVADPASVAPHKGYVMSLIRDEHLHGGDVAVYLCGPPPMVEAVREHFGDRGVRPAGFYYEKFAPSAPAGRHAAVPTVADAEPAAGPARGDEPRPAAVAGATETDRLLVLTGEGRGIAGRQAFPPATLRPLRGGSVRSALEEMTCARAIAGQVVWPAGDGTGRRALDAGDPLRPAGAARAIAGQELVPTPGEAAPPVSPMRRALDDATACGRPAFVSPGRFDGKVVLVTGAAQGIGERTARRISAEGGTMVLADRSDVVTDLAGELSGDRDAHAVTADLETWEGAESVVAGALARFGRIDVAIHTVGGTIWAKPFQHYPPDQARAEINRSLYPTLWCCRAVLPVMIEQGHGTIVNVSSVATRGLNRVPYAAAKGGVNAITSALALEAAPHGIRVVATAPGGTDAPARRIPRGPAPESESEQAWYRTIVDQTVESSLLKRYGTLDEQAAALTFLASDEASYITGTVLPVAGGDLG